MSHLLYNEYAKLGDWTIDCNAYKEYAITFFKGDASLVVTNKSSTKSVDFYVGWV